MGDSIGASSARPPAPQPWASRAPQPRAVGSVRGDDPAEARQGDRAQRDR